MRINKQTTNSEPFCVQLNFNFARTYVWITYTWARFYSTVHTIARIHRRYTPSVRLTSLVQFWVVKYVLKWYTIAGICIEHRTYIGSLLGINPESKWNFDRTPISAHQIRLQFQQNETSEWKWREKCLLSETNHRISVISNVLIQSQPQIRWN